MRKPADQAKAAAEKEAEELARLSDLAARTFGTEDGKAFLSYLCKRFQITGRTFVPDASKQTVCPIRAAIRDGERAVPLHIITLIRMTKPDYPLPL